MAENLSLFLGQMLRRPTQVVALAPSSNAVARKMTRGVEQVQGPIVEIGPGTGSFTRMLLDRGVAPDRLTLLETNEKFCQALASKFPGVRVMNRPAQDIRNIGLRNIGAVISGVPVLARPQIQREVVGRAFDVMSRNGFFTQITYAPQSPISPEMQLELGIYARHRGLVWSNIPPAHVFEFRRQSH